MVTRRPLARIFTRMRAIVLDLLPILFLIGFSGAVFATELDGGPIFFGRDTTTFYYPLTQWAAEELRAGRPPLWTPTIFGGYPIFADGEIGLLSPFQTPLLSALPMPFAYSLGRALAFAIAALGLYLYTRTLGANPLGATIGALAFAYGSFMVGHLQHDNILRSAVWLPWLLLAAEQTLRTPGPGRLGWLAAAALILAFEAVGVHIQPVLMSLLVLGLALLFGPLGRTSVPTVQAAGVSRAAALGRLVYDLKVTLARKRLGVGSLDWLLARAFLGVAIVGLGLGLAAAQLVPLYQLGLRSIRASLVTYDYATSFAVTPPQLLTLIFPAMFNYDAERHWSFWAPHETTLYVGVAPLLLAILALWFVRGRAIGFFGIVAVASLMLVFGDYLPIKPYTFIWSLPGFGYLRAPARFSLLFCLSLAVLAALGTTWLVRQARYHGSSRPVIGLLSGMLLLPVILGLSLAGFRWWLRFDPVRATDLFSVLLHTSKENWQLGPWHLYYGISEMTRPDNPRTALGLALLVAAPLLLRLWMARPRLEAVWGGLLLAVTAFDLLIFATSFYFQASVQALTPATPALTHLAAQQQPFRLYVEPVLNPRYGANQLAGIGIETVNGYSSLEPPRFSDYWWSIVGTDNFLLDLFNVRYVIGAYQLPGSRVYEGTVYHPYDQLMSGTAVNPSGLETFRVQPMRTTALTLVAAVEGLGEVPPGTPVAEVTLVGADGSRQMLPVRGGIDVAEYRAAEPGWPMAEYVGPRVVWAGSVFNPAQPHSPGDPIRLYGSTIPLTQPFDAVGVEVRTVTTVGRLRLFGLGLHDENNVVASVRPLDKAKYRPLHQDATGILVENTAARPRVSVIGEVLPADGPITADRLHALAWDPRNQAVVEGLRAEDMRTPGSSSTAGSIGEVRLLTYTPTEIVAQADMTAPGYLILADRFDDGWRATVDDRDVAIARANGVERLVAVPAGAHVVRFSYVPYPVYLGLAVSAVAVVGWLGVLVIAVGQAVGIKLPKRQKSGVRSQ